MKCGPWKIGAVCLSCDQPVDGDPKDGYLNGGSGIDCCPACGVMRPDACKPWPKARFRRVKDGWLSPWRWQKWQEPVVGGVEVRFTMAQPKEGAGDE